MLCRITLIVVLLTLSDAMYNSDLHRFSVDFLCRVRESGASISVSSTIVTLIPKERIQCYIRSMFAKRLPPDFFDIVVIVSECDKPCFDSHNRDELLNSLLCDFIGILCFRLFKP